MEDATVRTPHAAGTGYATWQSFTNVTGDGRPDLVFPHDDQLWVAVNGPGSAGTTTLGGAWATAPDATFAHGAFEIRTAANQRFTYNDSNVDYVWRQAMNVNGDGRVDIIDAAAEAHRWVVYLNTPFRRWGEVGAAVLCDHHAARPLTSRGHGSSEIVPLAKRTTGRDRSIRSVSMV